MKIIITNNEQETFDFGVSFGEACHGGEIFALLGDLGAGKTKFLQGLAFGLGVKRQVTSPTFNILKVYESLGKVKYFCHVDAYRLRSGQDLIQLGIEEFFDSLQTVTAIEWANKVKKIWPARTKIISIKSLTDKQRQISIRG